jgi:hypothetical protein
MRSTPGTTADVRWKNAEGWTVPKYGTSDRKMRIRFAISVFEGFEGDAIKTSLKAIYESDASTLLAIYACCRLGRRDALQDLELAPARVEVRDFVAGRFD